MAENREDACLGQDRKSPSIALFSLAEEGCLRLMPANSPCPVGRVVYHKSLNVLLAFSQDGRASVVDIASGTVLHDTKSLLSAGSRSSGIFSPTHMLFSDNKFVYKYIAESLKCLSISDRGTLVIAQERLLGVRKDFGRTLLLESILQPPVNNEDELVKVELPHNEVRIFTIK